MRALSVAIGLVVVALFGPVGPVHAENEPEKPATSEVAGIVHAATDGMILLGVQVSARAIESLKQLHFRVVSSDKEIAAHTIYRDRAYSSHTLDSKLGLDEEKLKALVGKSVVCTVERRPSGYQTVINLQVR